MSDYTRVLNLDEDLKRKSVFLFGPRQTGKTYWLKKHFPNAPFFNLLLADVFLKVSQRPQIIREQLLAKDHDPNQPVIIDEIQKLPVLLNEVHHLIEEKRFRFVLTGSSPRKLFRNATNLLGGRALTRHLFPLSWNEIPKFHLIRYLNFGGLPAIYDSPEPEQDLMAYVGTYLQEEIQAEGLTRKIENFSRVLETAALVSGELINFSNIANDSGVPARTIIEYFSIIRDTLFGYLLEPYSKTKKRKAISTAKFYLFDVGVCNLLAGRKAIRPRTELFGKTFEHLVLCELKAFLSYHKDTRPLRFWRSQSGYEVDFLVGDEIAIEVKSTELVTEKHLSGINALSQDIKLRKKIVVSLDSSIRQINDITVYPITLFLEALWAKTL